MSKSEAIRVAESGCASIAGELNFESVPALFRESEKLFTGANAITSIDLCEVTSADSAGLALLLEWQAMQLAASRKLEIINAPPSLMSLAILCEADEVINLSGRNHGA